MGASPHTVVRRGKRVMIVTKDGVRHIGKFFEKKGRWVVLENVKIYVGEIKSMKIIKRPDR